MTYPLKKHIALSEKMNELKGRIEQLQREQKLSLLEHANKKGRLSSLILEGVQKTLAFLGAVLSSVKEIPIIGFAVQMFATIPNAITTLTDKKSSVASKVLAMTFLLITTGLGITAFALGGMVAAGIALAFASLGTLVEGISLVASLVNKYQSSNDYKEKKAFIDLLQKRDLTALENDVYKERLEIRALELEHLLNKATHLPLAPIKEELEFIKQIRSKRGWDKLAFPENSPQARLVTLYKERDELLLYLETTIKYVDQEEKNSTNFENPLLVALVTNIQHQISEFDEEIENIVMPLHKLKRNDLIANETIAKSVTNFALGGVGVIFGVVGVMAILGALAMPPVAATAFLGLGIGLAVFGVIKWSVELYLNREEKKIMKERTKEHEEIILEEALNGYDHKLQKESSYSTSLSRILASRNSADESPSKSQNKVKSDLVTAQVATTEPSIEPAEKESDSFRLTSL